jgi:hypothetical protein
MYKLVTFAGYDNRFGPHIFPIEDDVDRSIGHIKMARELPPEIEQYIRSAQPIPGKTQLLIDAMGAGEYYGSNVNGDHFPEEALRHKGPAHGFETFMHYAFPFKHHVNKDPARAYGDKVTLSAYDPQMHRVLLVLRVDDAKCQDILGDLAKNRYWDVSMGCRVPWDECSICKNRARNRGEYCAHLRYQMNKILPDGRRVCAYNRLPKFFDISFVTIGAEKASHVLKKVAHDSAAEIRSKPSAELGEIYYGKLAAAEKSGAETKAADIKKEIPTDNLKIDGVTPSDQAKVDAFTSDAGQVKALEPEIPTAALDNLAGFPLRDVFATLTALGIDLRPQEFQRIILVKQGARAMANKLAAHRLVFDESNPSPRTPTWSNEFARYDDRYVNEKVALVLRPYLEARSCYPEILENRLHRMEKSADFDGYDRSSKWYPMTEEGKRLSSGTPGLIPASMALAAGFMVFRQQFPQLMEKAPGPIRTIAKHPWMLPLLIGAGVGASVGLSGMTAPRQLAPQGTGSGLDGKKGSAYHHPKIAGIDPFSQIGQIPGAYIRSSVQRKMMTPQLSKYASSSILGSETETEIFHAVRRLARRKEMTNGNSR